MLDQGDQPVRHEPASPHRDSTPGDLADLDVAAARDNLDPSSSLGRGDLERLDALACVDHGLDAVSLHGRILVPSTVLRETSGIPATAPATHTSTMAKDEALKRLGGGRGETRDGRFQIEPESGTWVIVDTTQTNEFGLPLVRGPFPSLGAAKDAIETAREDDGPVESPLAERISQPKPPTQSKARTSKGK